MNFVAAESREQYDDRIQRAVQFINEEFAEGLLRLSGAYLERLSDCQKIRGGRLQR